MEAEEGASANTTFCLVVDLAVWTRAGPWHGQEELRIEGKAAEAVHSLHWGEGIDVHHGG